VLPPAHTPAPPQNQAIVQQPPDKGTIVQAIVARICQGFDRHRDTGEEIAIAVSVEFGEAIEAFGLEKALTDPAAMTAELAPYPQLAAALVQRTTHAKWKEFEDSFWSYMVDRWSPPEAEPKDEPSKPGPQPVA